MSTRKWCLTGSFVLYCLTSGTPVHNGLQDMYPLFRFLEVPIFSAFPNFKENFMGEGNREGAIRIQVYLRSLMLRRKKDDKVDGRPLIVLPEKV